MYISSQQATDVPDVKNIQSCLTQIARTRYPQGGRCWHRFSADARSKVDIVQFQIIVIANLYLCSISKEVRIGRKWMMEICRVKKTKRFGDMNGPVSKKYVFVKQKYGVTPELIIFLDVYLASRIAQVIVQGERSFEIDFANSVLQKSMIGPALQNVFSTTYLIQQILPTIKKNWSPMIWTCFSDPDNVKTEMNKCRTIDEERPIVTFHPAVDHGNLLIYWDVWLKSICGLVFNHLEDAYVAQRSGFNRIIQTLYLRLNGDDRWRLFPRTWKQISAIWWRTESSCMWIQYFRCWRYSRFEFRAWTIFTCHKITSFAAQASSGRKSFRLWPSPFSIDATL